VVDSATGGSSVSGRHQSVLDLTVDLGPIRVRHVLDNDVTLLRRLLDQSHVQSREADGQLQGRASPPKHKAGGQESGLIKASSVAWRVRVQSVGGARLDVRRPFY
jgi:hypothetical protein